MACLANFLGVDISNIEDIEELTKMEDRTNLGQRGKGKSTITGGLVRR